MIKVEDLLDDLEKDSSLTNKQDAIHKLISSARSNETLRKLTFLIRNVESACLLVVDKIKSWSVNDQFDLRVFCLLLSLHDANQTQAAIDMSSTLSVRSDLVQTKLLALSILLKDSLYGKIHITS